MNNKITTLFATKKEPILNMYFTAGYPKLTDTVTILKELSKSGVDLIEIGMPYSDPLADGPTIQQSSLVALENGLTLDLLFDQIVEARKSVSTPFILMGYVNQLIQYGIEKFVERCAAVGVDGLIVPDLPAEMYEAKYQELFEKHNIAFTFLVTPQTSDSRVKKLDALTSGFLYIVSSASITGAKSGIDESQVAYFKRIKTLVTSPSLIGFGISDNQTFTTASAHARGAIIGSAFIKMLGAQGISGIAPFVKAVLGR